MFKCIAALIDAFKYEGVPQGLPKLTVTKSPTQRSHLTEKELGWCDRMLPGFKKCREQAEAARGK